MKRVFFLLPLLAAACSIVESYEGAKDTPARPAEGYKRSDYINPYISPFLGGGAEYPLHKALKTRSDWTAKSPSFTKNYPSFNIGFSYFQNTSTTARFSFAERLFFSDVFDLMRYAVNSEVFAQEILKRQFYENDGVSPKSAQTILNEIQDISFSVSLAKRPLGNGVLAEASVGGYLNIIWVRDDIDYSTELVNEMAVIILHEVTHNLGYLHPSQVNYGVHLPCQTAIQKSTESQAQSYISLTPYYENLMINNVRELSKSRSARASSASVSCTREDIFPKP